MIRLYHIPNLVLGIKLRDKPVRFKICHLSIRYHHADLKKPGSLSVGVESIADYLLQMFNSILIEAEDKTFDQFVKLEDIVPCIKYSYNDLTLDDLHTADDDNLRFAVITKLEDIIKTNLALLLYDQGIEISLVDIEYE